MKITIFDGESVKMQCLFDVPQVKIYLRKQECELRVKEKASNCIWITEKSGSV